MTCRSCPVYRDQILHGNKWRCMQCNASGKVDDLEVRPVAAPYPAPFSVAVMGTCKLKADCAPKDCADCLDQVAEKARQFLDDPTRRVQFRAAVTRAMTMQRDALLDIVEQAMKAGDCPWCLTTTEHKRDCVALTLTTKVRESR